MSAYFTHTPDTLRLQTLNLLEAHQRLSGHIHRTPLVSSASLNHWLGHNIYFKLENQQRIGAFKARGGLNTLLKHATLHGLPKKVVAYSSGNHAQAVAYAAQKLGIPASIFMMDSVSTLKKQATQAYGAELVLTPTRPEAEALALEEQKNGALLIPPYDHEDVIAGQGTACLEALEDMPVTPDAIFAPVGGGGLISGTYLAAKLRAPHAAVVGAEPLLANDAAISRRTGRIYTHPNPYKTIADGVRTLHVSERTFACIRLLDDIIEITEEEILYWTQWMTHLLKVTVEPTSALALAAAVRWSLSSPSSKPCNLLAIVSGGNLSADTQRAVWQEDNLSVLPSQYISHLRQEMAHGRLNIADAG